MCLMPMSVYYIKESLKIYELRAINYCNFKYFAYVRTVMYLPTYFKHTQQCRIATQRKL